MFSKFILQTCLDTPAVCAPNARQAFDELPLLIAIVTATQLHRSCICNHTEMYYSASCREMCWGGREALSGHAANVVERQHLHLHQQVKQDMWYTRSMPARQGLRNAACSNPLTTNIAGGTTSRTVPMQQLRLGCAPTHTFKSNWAQALQFLSCCCCLYICTRARTSCKRRSWVEFSPV